MIQGMIRNWTSGLPENSFQKQMKSVITLALVCLCGIQVLRSTLKEEIVRSLFWERIMRIILQKNNVVYYYDPSGDAWLLLGAG